MKVFRKKYVLIITGALMLFGGIVLYNTFFKTLTINPLDERQKMLQLKETKEQFELRPFQSDGCSGAVSDAWRLAVRTLPETFPEIAGVYADVESPPFEFACIEHDRLYHVGEGGYVGRLRADNKLREDILTYAIDHTDDIIDRTGLEYDESALFLYEVIAEAIYRGVRIGGAPCTGQPYAWGYGYNDGVCLK